MLAAWSHMAYAAEIPRIAWRNGICILTSLWDRVFERTQRWNPISIELEPRLPWVYDRFGEGCCSPSAL